MDQVILSTLIAVGVCWYNNKVIKENLKEQLSASASKTYKELITAERIEWINSLRESMADYLSNSYYIDSFYSVYPDQMKKSIVDNPIYKEVIKEAFLIKIKLNPKQLEHNEVIKILDNMQGILIDFFDGKINESTFNDYEDELPKFEKACINLLKKEWEQIKKEANPEQLSVEKEINS